MDEHRTRGKITLGIEPNSLVERTIEFIYAHLPAWRDHSDRLCEDAEEALNSQLCKHMNVLARQKFSMVHFNVEERQDDGHRKVDLAATPDEAIDIHTNSYTIYDPLLVIEAKRLPTPGTGREKEYLTGFENRSGGVQRFRLGLHGNKLETVAMIGYVQSSSSSHWHQQVNRWISEEIESRTDKTCDWSTADELGTLSLNNELRTALCESSHQRINAVSTQISIRHLWVEMSIQTSDDDSKN